MNRTVRLAALLAVLLPAPARAQSWEMTPLVGYTPAVTLDRHAPEVDGVDIAGGFTWSFQAGRFLSPNLGVEAVWSEQFSAYRLEAAGGSAELYSISASHLHGNVVYQFGAADARLRPFVFGGGGATFFRARDIATESKFSFGLGGGVKYFPWRTIGFRGHVRYKPTMLDDEDAGDFCDAFGFCQSSLQQFEMMAGAVVRF